MKKVILAVVMFAIGIGMIVGIIIPIAKHGKTTGTTSKSSLTSADSSIAELSTEID